MYLIPLLATLMSSIFAGALPITARNLGHRGVAVFSILSLVIAFISSALIWVDLYLGASPVWIDLFGAWFEVGTVTASWVFYYDLLTAHMLFTVTSVSLAVHIYAVVYMRNDPHLSLFMSYLSLFTFFMLVYVCGDNLLVMLVGWEGPNQGLSAFRAIDLSLQPLNNQLNSNSLIMGIGGVVAYKKSLEGQWPLQRLGYRKYYTRIPAKNRIGPHTKQFQEILTGFLLGDGWLEKRGDGIRMGISLTEKFEDVAEYYLKLLFKLGYTDRESLGLPLVRKPRLKTQSHPAITTKPYYQIRTFTFTSLVVYWNKWYFDGGGVASLEATPPLTKKKLKTVKILPLDLKEDLTPLSMAIWVMGDGSGMADGGFKLSTFCFTKEENEYLCRLLQENFNIKATILIEGPRGYTYIRIWKQSVPMLLSIVKPYIKESCLYKFRFCSKA